MKIILTGCNGKLGFEIARTLVDRGHSVIGTDLVPRPDAPCRVVLGDLLDPFFIHRVMDEAGDVEAIVHIANHPNQQVAPPDRILRENGAMNAHVFLAAVDRGVRRVVFSSSIQACLGGNPHDQSLEEVAFDEQIDRFPIDLTTPTRPQNAYGLSKVLGERLLEEMCSRTFSGGRLSAASLRFPWIAGQERVMWRWAARHAGDHTAATVPMRDFGSYVSRGDAALATAMAAEASFEGHERLWVVAPDTTFFPIEPADIAREQLSHLPGVEWVERHGHFFDTERTTEIIGWRGTPVFSERMREVLAKGSA